MSGRPGRSGGHNRLTLADHAARGTKPRSPTVRGLRLVSADHAPPEPLAPELLAGLLPGGLGLAFIERCWSDYEGWTPASVILLREAGMTIDSLSLLRGQKGERAAQQLLVRILAELRLEA